MDLKNLILRTSNLNKMNKININHYFVDFALNEQLLLKLKKLDLSYNSLNCATFFSFLEKNKIFENLVSLNLNGNELDDTFYEKCMIINAFPKLEHFYLNSNKFKQSKVNVFPDFSESLLFKSKNKSYVTLFPPVFPPLPIKKQIIINVNINFSYAIKNFLDINERNALNKILSESALNNAEIDFTKIDNASKKLIAFSFVTSPLTPNFLFSVKGILESPLNHAFAYAAVL